MVTLKAKFKISLVFLQVVGNFPGQLNVNYPKIFTQFSLFVSTITTLRLYDLFPTLCMVKDRSNLYFLKLLIQTLAPVGLIALGGGYYAVRRWGFAPLPARKLQELNSSFMFRFLFFTYTVFVPCSTVVFDVFNCDLLGHGERYLFADYTTSCGTRLYTLMTVYAAVFTLIYPIGIPTMYFVLLYHRRNALDPVLPEIRERPRMSSDREGVLKVVVLREADDSLRPLAFLFDSYEPQFWWWEVFNCFLRLLLTNANIYINDSPTLRPFVLLIIALVSVKLYSYLDPYLLDSDDSFAEIGQWLTVATLIFALIFQVRAASPTSGMGIMLNSVYLLMTTILGACAVTHFSAEIRFLQELVREFIKNLYRKENADELDGSRRSCEQLHKDECDIVAAPPCTLELIEL